MPGATGVIYSALARVNPDNPDEFAVDVDVSWEAAGVQRARKFTTLLLREVPFGERLRRRFIQARSFPPPPEMASDEEGQSAASSTSDRP